MEPTQIGIAIVFHNGCILTGIRGESLDLAEFAEFPGGKCETLESPAACAVRECLEETGLHVVTEECIEQTRFKYEHATVDLHFWLCRPDSTASESTLKLRNDFVWTPVEKLRELTFPPANAGVLEKLSSRFR